MHSRLLRTIAGHAPHLAAYFRNPGPPWPHRMQQWHSTSQTLSLTFVLCALTTHLISSLHAGSQWVMPVSSCRTGHPSSPRPLPHRPARSGPDCACRFAPSWLCAFVTLRFRIHVGWETVSWTALGCGSANLSVPCSITHPPTRLPTCLRHPDRAAR